MTDFSSASDLLSVDILHVYMYLKDEQKRGCLYCMKDRVDRDQTSQSHREHPDQTTRKDLNIRIRLCGDTEKITTFRHIEDHDLTAYRHSEYCDQTTLRHNEDSDQTTKQHNEDSDQTTMQHYLKAHCRSCSDNVQAHRRT